MDPPKWVFSYTGNRKLLFYFITLVYFAICCAKFVFVLINPKVPIGNKKDIILRLVIKVAFNFFLVSYHLVSYCFVAAVQLS